MVCTTRGKAFHAFEAFEHVFIFLQREWNGQLSEEKNAACERDNRIVGCQSPQIMVAGRSTKERKIASYPLAGKGSLIFQAGSPALFPR